MPKVAAHDAAIYTANDLIMALTEPQPTNSFILIGDDKIVALRPLATIFQTSITKNQFQIRGCQTLHPPAPTNMQSNQKTRDYSPHSTTMHHAIPHTTPTNRRTKTRGGPRDPPPPPPPPPRHPAQQQTTYHPIIANLRPQYPTIHEGLLEDLFPLIRSANLVTDPGTGKQLEYRQLINHPDSKLCQLWQRSSANEFG